MRKNRFRRSSEASAMLRSIEIGITSPCWRLSSGTKPMPAAIAAFGEAGGSRRPCTSTPPASARAVPTVALAGLVDAGEACERDDLTGPDLERDVREHALARQPVDL